MMAVAVSTSPTFTAGRPQELWNGDYSHGMSSSCGPPGATSSNYDVVFNGTVLWPWGAALGCLPDQMILRGIPCDCISGF